MARRRLYPEVDPTDSVRVTLRIPASHLRAIDAYARHKGISRSEVVARIAESLGRPDPLDPKRTVSFVAPTDRLPRT